jgi:V8-like Glu-specific endopeptidase
VSARFAAITVLVLATLASYTPPTQSATLSSIQPLFLNGEIKCTAFSVNKRERLWVTAAHCTLVEDTKTFSIGAPQNLVTVVRRDERFDLALLQGGLPAAAMELAEHAPSAGTEVYTEGYPIGMNRSLQFFGHVSSPRYIFPEEDFEVMALDVQGLPGISGAPVLWRSRVVGVFAGIYRPAIGQIAWGSTWGRLKDFVGPIWEGQR